VARGVQGEVGKVSDGERVFAGMLRWSECLRVFEEVGMQFPAGFGKFVADLQYGDRKLGTEHPKTG